MPSSNSQEISEQNISILKFSLIKAQLSQTILQTKSFPLRRTQNCSMQSSQQTHQNKLTLISKQNNPSEEDEQLRPTSCLRKIFRRIHLNQQVTTKNYIGCLIHYFMLSFVFVSVDSLQPMLLQQKFNVDRSRGVENFKNAEVIAFDIVVKLLCAPVMGYMADRLGRKIVNLYGILVISAMLALMPYAEQYWQYVLMRCVYATGAIAISVIPLLADYVDRRSRGTCAAILVFMSSLGALASAELNFSILSRLNSENKIYTQYGVAAGIILILGSFYTLYNLKPGNQYYVRSNNGSNKKTFRELIKIGKESLHKPQISSGYVAAFLARSDSILLSLYLVLWCYSFDEFSYEESSTKASALSGIAYSIIMLSCIFYGYRYENPKTNRRNLIAFMLLLASIGAFVMNFSPDIYSPVTFGALSVLGVGMSGLLTASLYLVNQFSTKQNRGYIMGLQTLSGIVGIAVETFIGAVLFEYSSRAGPFNLFAATCVLGGAAIWLIYFKNASKTLKQQKQDQTVESLIAEEEGIIASESILTKQPETSLKL